MNRLAEAFADRIEQVYSKYKPVVRQEVVEWAAQYKEETLAGVYSIVRDTFSNQYNVAPDIAILKQAYKDYRESIMQGVDDFLALPDPDYEARKRELTDKEREDGAEFMRRLLDGMKWGVHPTAIHQEWERDHDVQ